MYTSKRLLLPILALTIFMFSGLINQSNAQSVSSTEEIPFFVLVPCANGGAGELVGGTIILHTVIHTDKDGNVTKTHFQPQTSSLVGLTTGMAYKATGVTQFMFDSNLDNGATTFTFINRFHIVGKGVQFYAKDTFHTTVNANGETTTTVDNFSVECK